MLIKLSLFLILLLSPTVSFSATDWCADTDTHFCTRFEDAGTITDESANSNDCTESGTVTQQVTGKYDDYAVEFTEVASSHLNCGSDASIDWVSGGHSFAGWIGPDTQGNLDQGAIFDKGGIAGNGTGFRLANANDLEWRDTWSDGQARWSTTGDDLTVDGTWQHVAVSYDADSTTADADIYINGTLIAETQSSNSTGTKESGNASDFEIGISNGNQNEWDGDFDEFLYINQLLNSTEVNEIMDCGIDGTESGAGCQAGSRRILIIAESRKPKITYNIAEYQNGLKIYFKKNDFKYAENYISYNTITK